MGLTSALNTSLGGLSLNETSIDVLGNNIANAGTNGFKASNVLFTTQLSRTLSVGSRPTTSNGGTNPRQVGLGALSASIRKDFTQGSVTNSTSPSDLAIQGDGFFILDSPDGQVYSRNGNFELNSQSLLTNQSGFKVQGYGVDEDFNLVTTTLTDIQIPLGDLNVAQATQNVEIGGALLPTGVLGTQGSILTSDALTDAGNANAAITGTTLLTDVEATIGTPLFTVGETLEFTPSKGGRSLDPMTLQVTALTTAADFADFLDRTLGIQNGGGVPNDATTGAQPGVSINGGAFEIVGNSGTVNDIAVTIGNITSDGATVSMPFTKSASANGESAITDFVIFDSLGEPVTMKMTSVLESRSSNNTIFRYFLESADDNDGDIAVSSGTITFDSNGNVTNYTPNTFGISRVNTAADEMDVTIDLSNISGISSASAGSTLKLTLQDGSDPGTLASFVIDETGIINGVFDNGIIRTLGQITLSRFSNPQGLLEFGNSTFQEGVSSGPPFLVTPGNFGAGTIRAGSIELSNTDVGRSLVDLIVASTNYRGNARVISSVQQLVDELLVLGR
ncbi:flagellar hook-basal body complex protein [Gimesia sp.]|uniref:flagellar hook-basal body complex protein n=1 Tax=Gimesia sp. TaxID=2024833 RepID=UPI000C542290|nr:flagellar hook-basal body complex protein [Gimesia sp.]MAX40240.1 flagellar biosynthesis protein FlgE [Gimesia sp.]|tara:strand:+ start:35721 stop:37409 length:1689 start_codon:yes stop_codon:yes gene_type:complete